MTTSDLPHDIKLLRLKQKLIGEYVSHDMELTWLLENIDDDTSQRLIDKLYSQICKPFFDEYGVSN